MSRMKEYDKIPENELNKMKTSIPPDAEFKTLVIRISMNLGKEKCTHFNKEIETFKKTVINKEHIN